MVFNEDQLIVAAKPYFETARAGDWEHALRVVKWVKELGVGRSDLPLLITAAYLHDIGWSGVAPRGKIDFNEMLLLEPAANKNSNPLIQKVLTSLDWTAADIREVQRLVKAADSHESNDEDEALIVDADNLSKLCLEHLQEKYQPSNFNTLIDTWEKQLSLRIKTEKGRLLFPDLLSKLKEVVSSLE